jgi:hypothetical protein
MNEQESDEQKAVRLLNRQLGGLMIVRGLNYERGEFTAWRDTTTSVLQKYLGSESPHTVRFMKTRFTPSVFRARPWGSGPRPKGYISPEFRDAFSQGCETAEATIKAAIGHIQDFGVRVEAPKHTPAGRGRSGGISQNFLGPTQVNQALAADSAVQRIGRIGNQAGIDLNELSNLLQQSQDLSPNQVMQGVADIEGLAEEVEKPEEKRNWKAVLEYGLRVLDLAGKAVDLGGKLAPYLPAVVALVESAKLHP